MIQKTTLLLLLLLIVQGCDSLTYESDTRIAFEGRIVDESGLPLKGIPVSILIEQNGGGAGFYPSASNLREIISNGTTDSNGNYTLLFPFPQDADDISLLINMDTGRNGIKPGISCIAYYNIRRQDFTGYKINFGTTALYNPENSTTLTIDTSALTYSADISFTGLINHHFVNFNFDEFGGGPYTETFEVARNQVITYRIRRTYYDYNEEEDIAQFEEGEIYIGEEPVTYIFE